MARATLVCMARNEARNIREWLLFHAALGFDRIILYDHTPIDGTPVEVANARNHTNTDIILIDWNETPKPQKQSYNHALATYGATTDWMCFLDSDEFLILEKDRFLGCFLDRIDNHSAVSINWLCFGSGGHIDFPPGLVLESFKWRAVDDFSVNRHVKSFVRPSETLGFFNPHYFFMREGLDYVDADGNSVEWLKPGKSVRPTALKTARINHYFTRSKAHFANKLKLPLSGKQGHVRDDNFSQMDRNEIFDDSATRLYGDIVSSIRAP